MPVGGVFLPIGEAFMYVGGTFPYASGVFSYVGGAFPYASGVFSYVDGAFPYASGTFSYASGTKVGLIGHADARQGWKLGFFRPSRAIGTHVRYLGGIELRVFLSSRAVVTQARCSCDRNGGGRATRWRVPRAGASNLF